MRSYKGFDHQFSLDGKVALITGGAQGIGKAMATLFVEKGAHVALFDVNEHVLHVADELCSGVRQSADEPCSSVRVRQQEDEAADDAQSCGDHAPDNVAAPCSEHAPANVADPCSGHAPAAKGYVVDITDEAATDAAFAAFIRDFGRVDILCNVAGVGGMTPAEEITRAEWDHIVSVNLTALFFLTQRVGRFMIKHGIEGKIISMASDASLIGLAGHGHYGPTKAGVDNLTKVLANEWGPHGINVNCISPTVVMTEMGREFWVGEVAEEMLAKIPAGRFVEPEEVAAAALFLASDASDMISGHNLVIDGAFTVC